MNVHAEGQPICNRSDALRRAALTGMGVAYVLEDVAKPYIDDGRLMRVLEHWCPPFPGFHLTIH